MVAIHAIGDRAVDGVLDLFDRLLSEGADAHSLRIEHASLMRPDQVARCAASGVTACVQPAFLASESDWVIDRVGTARAPWVYPFRSMLEAGIPLAGSSDCPVEPPHPLWGISAAVDRHGIVPSERLTAGDAVEMFTTGAARALREGPPLAPGSPADFVVVDRDITSGGAEAIRATKVVATYVGGRRIEREPDQAVWID
jgi:predicted amidohydrolase YtcJ